MWHDKVIRHNGRFKCAPHLIKHPAISLIILLIISAKNANGNEISGLSPADITKFQSSTPVTYSPFGVKLAPSDAKLSTDSKGVVVRLAEDTIIAALNQLYNNESVEFTFIDKFIATGSRWGWENNKWDRRRMTNQQESDKHLLRVRRLQSYTRIDVSGGKAYFSGSNDKFPSGSKLDEIILNVISSSYFLSVIRLGDAELAGISQIQSYKLITEDPSDGTASGGPGMYSEKPKDDNESGNSEQPKDNNESGNSEQPKDNNESGNSFQSESPTSFQTIVSNNFPSPSPYSYSDYPTPTSQALYYTSPPTPTSQEFFNSSPPTPTVSNNFPSPSPYSYSDYPTPTSQALYNTSPPTLTSQEFFDSSPPTPTSQEFFNSSPPTPLPYRSHQPDTSEKEIHESTSSSNEAPSSSPTSLSGVDIADKIIPEISDRIPDGIISNSTTSSTKTGVIVGSTFAILIIIIAFVICLAKRKQNKNSEEKKIGKDNNPNVDDPTSSGSNDSLKNGGFFSHSPLDFMFARTQSKMDDDDANDFSTLPSASHDSGDTSLSTATGSRSRDMYASTPCGDEGLEISNIQNVVSLNNVNEGTKKTSLGKSSKDSSNGGTWYSKVYDLPTNMT